MMMSLKTFAKFESNQTLGKQQFLLCPTLQFQCILKIEWEGKSVTANRSNKDSLFTQKQIFKMSHQKKGWKATVPPILHFVQE